MKIYISVDMEGISGITDRAYIGKGEWLYPVGQRLATADVNAAVRGAFDAGADEVVGPFALPEGVRVCLDRSLRRFETVFPAAGSAASAIELSCDELQKCTGGEWVDVCKVAGD